MLPSYAYNHSTYLSSLEIPQVNHNKSSQISMFHIFYHWDEIIFKKDKYKDYKYDPFRVPNENLKESTIEMDLGDSIPPLEKTT